MENDCKQLITQALTEEQREQVTAVALNMWQAYANAVNGKLPQAEIVHDRPCQRASQSSGRLGAASREQNPGKAGRRPPERKAARSWALKELFRKFWDHTYADNAQRHFEHWYSWATRSRLEPIKEKARMIKNHLPNMLT